MDLISSCGLNLLLLFDYCFYNFKLLNLSAFTITETELKLIAKAAIIGDSKTPKNGYKTPAAIGTPKTL